MKLFNKLLAVPNTPPDIIAILKVTKDAIKNNSPVNWGKNEAGIKKHTKGTRLELAKSIHICTLPSCKRVEEEGSFF